VINARCAYFADFAVLRGTAREVQLRAETQFTPTLRGSGGRHIPPLRNGPKYS